MDKGRPKKYLTIEEWNRFLGNHWRHLNWKVNGMIAILLVILLFLVAIFSLGLMSLFGG